MEGEERKEMGYMQGEVGKRGSNRRREKNIEEERI